MKLAVIVILSLAFSGCSNGGETPEVAAPTVGAISGFVVDDALRGIAGANVTLAGNRTVTDLAGAFAFENLTPGAYVISAQAPTYLDRQVSVSVSAGNTTQVRLNLPFNASALAFHQVFQFKGFVDLHAGSRAPDVGECQCTFTVPTESPWQTILVEASWQDAINPIAFETEFAWRVTSGTTQANGTGASPLLGRIDAGDLEAAADVEVRVEPHSDWIFSNQQFEVAVSVWYGEPAPPDFRPLKEA